MHTPDFAKSVALAAHLLGLLVVAAAAVATAATAPLPTSSASAPQPRQYGTPLTFGAFVQQCASEPRETPVVPTLTLPCQAFVIGFIESAGLLEYETKTGPRYCLPVEVSAGDLVAMLVEMGDRKDLHEYPAAMILRGTLEARFACPPEMKGAD